MPAADIVQLVHAAVERNRGIPAVLDAYGEFAGSPIGPLELLHLDEVFARILDNLSQRYPDIASKRAATAARNDIMAFLAATNSNADRVKQVLRSDLSSVESVMVASISERFSRMNTEERRAIDATLRLIRRSRVEILFRGDAGKQLASSGREFERFFAAVKAESPTIRELRYENLIVEKAIFDKLILKAKDKDYSIWVPSFFARQGADTLISRAGVPNEHLMLSRIRELESQSKLEQLRSVFTELTENQGVLGKGEQVPPELSDFVQKVGELNVIPPIDLDDIFAFFEEEAEKKERARAAEEERIQIEQKSRRDEQERKHEMLRQRMRPTASPQVTTQFQAKRASGEDSSSILLGKQLDFDQLVSAINRRVPERDLQAQVKQLGDYYLELGDFKKGIAIVGSSGSGRSATLKRLIDGIASRGRRLIVIDPKGEHRGVAWKYKWKVFAFAGDSQAQEFRAAFFGQNADKESTSRLVADLIQEWVNQQGQTSCTDQQRERIASIIRAESGTPDLSQIVTRLSAEPDLADLAQRLKKNLLSKSSFAKIFSESAQSTGDTLLTSESILFDISGRGLKDPTTREERQIISVILLRDLAQSGLKDSTVVIEDSLDRFKSEALKSKARDLVKKLRSDGNSIIATARSQVREFVIDQNDRDTAKKTGNYVEIVHRLSGEKVITEEFSNFNSNVPTQTLTRIVGFLPRGYALTSSYVNPNGETVATSAIKVEPLQF